MKRRLKLKPFVLPAVYSLLVVFLLRDIKWVTYLIGIIEIFLRLIDYIANNLGISEIASFVNKYFPYHLL